MEEREYITPAEATHIRVHNEGAGQWAIDAADDAGGYIEFNWNRDGHPDATMSMARAIERVPEFVAHVGLPAGLPVKVKECDPIRVIAVIQPDTPARVVCYPEEGDGEWTIETQGVTGQPIFDHNGDYLAIWHEEENGCEPITEEQAVELACGLRADIERPALPIYVVRDGRMERAR